MQYKAYEQLVLPKRFEGKLIADMQYLLNYKGIDIKRIILFGSLARGTYKVTSDIDLLVITDTSIDRYTRGDIASYLDEVVDGVTTDAVFYQEYIFETSESLFAKQIKLDGIIIYSKE